MSMLSEQRDPEIAEKNKKVLKKISSVGGVLFSHGHYRHLDICRRKSLIFAVSDNVLPRRQMSTPPGRQ